MEDRINNLEGHVNNLGDNVNNYRKLDRLDIALFSISSVVGLIFTIVIFTLGEISLLIFLPILIVGWFMPFYVWWTGGAFSSLVERVRGWTYFVTSVMLYFFVFFSMSIDHFLRPLFMYPLRDVPLFLTAAVFFIALIKMANGILAKKIFKSYKREFTPQVGEKISDTIVSVIINATLLMVSFTFFYLGYLCYLLYGIFPTIGMIFIIVMWLLFGTGFFIYSIQRLIKNERSIKNKLQKKRKA